MHISRRGLLLLCLALLAIGIVVLTRLDGPPAARGTLPGEVIPPPDRPSQPVALQEALRVEERVADVAPVSDGPAAEVAGAPRERREGLLPGRGWQRFAPRIDVPSDRIEVLVLDGERPAFDVPVSILTPTSAPRPERFEDVADPRHARRTDGSGIARFEPMNVGEYVVQAWIAAGFVLEGEYTVHDQGQGFRLVLRTGSGAIEGHVFGRDGRPCADARVTLRAQVQDAHAFVRWTRSDALGRYRFDRQPASFCILGSVQGDAPCDVLGGRARFVLEEGATHAVDLGSEHPPASWSGTLRAADGTRLPIATGLSFDEVGRGTQIVARTDGTGAFQVELPPGTWAVRSLALASGVEIDRAVVGAVPLARDVVVPGHVVIVTVSPRESAGGTLVLTELGGAGIDRPLHRSGDAYVVVLPAPGRHRLTAHPPDAFVEIPRAGSIVDVEPGASLVRIEITVRDAASRSGG